MKKTMFFGILCVIAGCMAVNTATAQIAWTPEQKSVWKTETAITELWKKGDDASAQEALEYYDDSYQGWNYRSTVPMSKENMKTRLDYVIKLGGKLLYWNATPLVIWVKGDFAYVDYYYSAIWQDTDGKKTNDHGRWLDVLMKKNGKWLLVGDHGGSDPKPESK